MPFVGREQDLETVGRSFQEATQGKGSVVFITGEAGIGKTTFINEFKARYVDARNAASKKKNAPEIRFAEAKCSELIGKGEAYAPFIELIGRLVADDKAFGSSKLADVVREIGADWFELVPVIGKALKLVSKTLFKWQSADGGRELAERKGNKEKFAQQYIQVMKVISEKHPLVLFVDDLHWADDSSIYLLFQLAREIQDRRILILGTYRPTDIQAVRGEKAHPLKDALGEMHRFGVCKEVKLGYFTSDHIRRYLDAAFPQNRLDAEFVAYLRDLTEGNPLFVTEQVKLLQEIGKIQTSEVSKTSEVSAPVWELRGTLRDADMPIPTSVEKTIEKRFERLKEDMQETLQYASVSGEQFDAAVVAQMLQQDELAVLKKLQTLDRVYQFVSEQKTDGRTTRGAVYQFIHSLVQKSLYGTLSDGIKVKLHAKAAEIIETLYSEQREAFAEELAAHWERGREYAKAAPYLLLSARKANRQSGYQEAKTHAQRGLEMLKPANPLLGGARGGSDQAMLRLQIELLLELATAEEAIGETKNSIDHAENAGILANHLNDQKFQGDVFENIGYLLLWNRASIDLDQIIKHFEKALTNKITVNDYESAVSMMESMRQAYGILGKTEGFLLNCQKVINLNRQVQKNHLNVTIFKLMGIELAVSGKYQDAYNSIMEGLKILDSFENPNLQIELLRYAAEYAIKLVNISLANEHYIQAKNVVRSITNQVLSPQTFHNVGNIAWHLGKYDEAIEFYQFGRNAAIKVGDLDTEARILFTLMDQHSYIGKFEEAIDYGMQCLAARQRLGKVRDIVSVIDWLGYIFRNQGNFVKAVEMRQQAILLSRQYGRDRELASYLESYQIDLRLLGQFKEAITVINEALSIFRKTKVFNSEVDCLTSLAVSHFCLGQIKEAISIMNQTELLKPNVQSRTTIMRLCMRHSQILTGIGHYQKAYDTLEEPVEDWLKGNLLYGDVPGYFLNSIHILISIDKIERAFSRLFHIEAFFKKRFCLDGIALMKNAYAQVYLAQGDLAKAESSLNEAIALFQQMNSFRLGEADLTLAALRLAQGQPSAALEAASAARKIFTEIEYYRAGEAILWQAKALFALRRFPDAQTRLKESAAEFKRLQQPHHLAEAQLLHGQMLAAAGQKEKALQNMLNAKATFAKLGLKRLEKEAERVISSMR